MWAVFLCEVFMSKNDLNRSRNRRTAFILLSVAVVFFVGIVVRRWLIGV